jgi:hypothetical protein
MKCGLRCWSVERHCFSSSNPCGHVTNVINTVSLNIKKANYSVLQCLLTARRDEVEGCTIPHIVTEIIPWL